MIHNSPKPIAVIITGIFFDVWSGDCDVSASEIAIFFHTKDHSRQAWGPLLEGVMWGGALCFWSSWESSLNQGLRAHILGLDAV